MNNDYVGYFGSFLISINLIPQIYHIYKIKNVKSISIISYFLNIFSAILMIAYGVLINKLPIIISNSMILIFSIIMLFLKYLYRENENENDINNIV
jgi:MtN3 and saliva related transmembrane protein